MKVCHMTSVHASNDIRIFVKECAALADAGYDTYLVAKGKSRRENGVKVVGVGEPPSGKLGRMASFANTVYRRACSLNCDVYHFHDPELLPYGIRLARAGKLVVFDSHEDVPAQILDKDWLPAGSREAIAAVYRQYESYAVRQFAAVVAATPYIAEQFRGRAKRIAVVNNYPMLDDIRFQTKPFAERDAVICYAGGINALRGEKIMCEAMQQVDGRLILAGAHAKETLHAGKGTVEYIGQIDRDGVNALYGNAVAGLCLLKPAKNYYYSQPIKMYEYMAAGLPFICSDFPGWKKTAEKTKAGICVNAENPEEVRHAIRYLLEHRSAGQEMGRRGRKAVEQTYNWDTEKTKLLRLYAELLRTKK